MKKLLIFVCALLVSMSALTAVSAIDSNGKINYNCSISADGKTATITVELSGYDKANSMMIIPDFDENELELIDTYWLIKGALAAPWDATTGDAVIAFENATDINTEIFEMVFKIKGNVSSLNEVKSELIVQSISQPSELPVETSPPETAIVGTKPVETSPPETAPAGTKPAGTIPPETDPVEIKPVETSLPETDPVEIKPVETSSPETDPVEINPVETSPTETDPVEINPVETSPPEIDSPETKPVETSPPKINYNDYSESNDYKTADDDLKGRLVDGYVWLVVMSGGLIVIAIGALAFGIMWVKRKYR